MRDSLKMIGVSVGIFAGIMGPVLLGVRGCNMALNNRSIEKSAYHLESRATGLNGHIEYTRYSDGSQDVKKYPGLGHRLFDSELHQDLNGNGLVDRIRKNGAEWKMNRLSELLAREDDYQSNKERFDEADKQLQGLMEKYPTKK